MNPFVPPGRRHPRDLVEELRDVAALLANQPKLKGCRVAVRTNAGGLGILCADVCEATGLILPALGDEIRAALSAPLSPEASVANPVDMLGAATAKTYASALPLLLEDTQVDAVVVLFVPTVTATAHEVADAIDRATAQAASEKPVLAVVLSANGIPLALRRKEAHVAAFPYPESAARALGRLAERAEWLRQPYGTIPVLAGIDRNAAERVVARALADSDDVEAVAVLKVHALTAGYVHGMRLRMRGPHRGTNRARSILHDH